MNLFLNFRSLLHLGREKLGREGKVQGDHVRNTGVIWKEGYYIILFKEKDEKYSRLQMPKASSPNGRGRRRGRAVICQYL